MIRGFGAKIALPRKMEVKLKRAAVAFLLQGLKEEKKK